MATGMVTPSQGAAKALSRAWGQKSIGRGFRAHGPVLRFGQMVQRILAGFLLFAVISSDRKVEVTGKKSRHSKNHIFPLSQDFRPTSTTSLHHFSQLSRRSAKGEPPESHEGSRMRYQQRLAANCDPCLGFLGSIRTTWHSISSREPKIGSCKMPMFVQLSESVQGKSGNM